MLVFVSIFIDHVEQVEQVDQVDKVDYYRCPGDSNSRGGWQTATGSFGRQDFFCDLPF